MYKFNFFYKLFGHIFLCGYGLLRLLGSHGFKRKKRMEENRARNRTVEERSPVAGFIEDQNKLGDFSYGVKDLSYSGCGLIAVYNACLFLNGGEEVRPGLLTEIIAAFEKKGSVCFGRFGTWPGAAAAFFTVRGSRVRTARSCRAMEKLACDCDVLLLTFMNNGLKPTRQMHTICVTKEGGMLLAHNSHGRLEKYENLQSLFYSVGDGSGKAVGIYMLGLSA